MNRRELITGIAASGAVLALPAAPKSYSYLQQMIEKYGEPQPCQVIVSIDVGVLDRTAMTIARVTASGALEIIDMDTIENRASVYESVDPHEISVNIS
jgi:hypothetical protein